MARTITLTITRQDPSTDQAPHEETFDVPVDNDTTLLEAVQWVREHLDASVAVRFACQSANACKECIADIDGRAGYLCTTRAEADVALGPVPDKRVVRDLVVRL